MNGSWVIARTSKSLTQRLTHTHINTHTHTNAGNNNKRRSKLASGINMTPMLVYQKSPTSADPSYGMVPNNKPHAFGCVGSFRHHMKSDIQKHEVNCFFLLCSKELSSQLSAIKQLSTHWILLLDIAGSVAKLLQSTWNLKFVRNLNFQYLGGIFCVEFQKNTSDPKNLPRPK